MQIHPALNITPALIPDHIEVYADPSSIKAGGIDTSTITARVKTVDNITITSYTEPITFETTDGSFSSSSSIDTITLYSTDENYNDGVATVELYPPSTAGTATITASSTYNSTNISGSVEVGFYIEADHIGLVANPQNIDVGGETCTITATIKDGETTVTGYSGTVKFSIVSGQASGKFTVIKIICRYSKNKSYLFLYRPIWIFERY